MQTQQRPQTQRAHKHTQKPNSIRANEFIKVLCTVQPSNFGYFSINKHFLASIYIIFINEFNERKTHLPKSVFICTNAHTPTQSSSFCWSRISNDWNRTQCSFLLRKKNQKIDVNLKVIVTDITESFDWFWHCRVSCSSFVGKEDVVLFVHHESKIP